MTLRGRIRVVWFFTIVFASMICFAIARSFGYDPMRVAFFLLVPLMLLLLGLQAYLLTKVKNRLHRLGGKADLATMRRDLAELGDFFRGQPGLREVLRISEASLLISDGKYQEAKSMLDAVDQNVL